MGGRKINIRNNNDLEVISIAADLMRKKYKKNHPKRSKKYAKVSEKATTYLVSSAIADIFPAIDFTDPETELISNALVHVAWMDPENAPLRHPETIGDAQELCRSLMRIV